MAVSWLPLDAKRLDENPGYCLYFLIDGDEVVYIGYTASLLARVKIHRKDKEFTDVYYLDCLSKEKVLQLEEYYIKTFQPKHNKMLLPAFSCLGASTEQTHNCCTVLDTAKVKRELKRIEWSCSDLAKVMGRRREWIVNKLHCPEGLSRETVEEFAKALGFNPNELVE